MGPSSRWALSTLSSGGGVSGSRPGDRSSVVSPFFGITTSQGDASEATHGISGAILRRFESYHTASLGLFRALFPKHSQSHPWKTQRPCGPPRTFSPSSPDAFLDSSTFLPPPRISQGPLRQRAAPPDAGRGPTGGLRRNLSRASGNRSLEEGLVIAAKVTALNEALRAQGATDRAASARPTSQPGDAFPDGHEVKQGETLRHFPP